MNFGISRRVVLAVGIEREDRIGAVRQRTFEAEPERGALALVRSLFDDGRPGGTCLFGGVVAWIRRRRRSPADGAAASPHDRRDPRALVVAGDQGDEAGSHDGSSEAGRLSECIGRGYAA